MIRFWVLWCLSISVGWAQHGVIVGKLKSGNQPVEFAHVIIKGTSKVSTTNEKGEFIFQQISPGRYELTTSAVGYQSITASVLVKPSEQTAIELQIQEDVAQLQEVVVTGTMREVSKMNSPIPVEVFTPALFLKNPTPNIFESLSVVNGVQPQINCNVCNTGDIHINGLEGPYTMILIDGMPIVSSLSTVYGLAGIPNSLVKRMEIVKGPASTLYGSEAVGGVINIITREPLGADKLKFDFMMSSVGEFNLDVSSGVQLSKSNGLVGVNYFNYTIPRDINDDNFTDVTLQNRGSVFTKWNFNRKSRKNFSVAARYVYENRWGGEMQWESQHRGTDIYYGESIYTNRVELLGNYETKIPGFNIDFSFNDHLQDSYYGIVKYLARQQVLFGQLRWSKEVGNHQLLAGIPIRQTFYDDNTPATESSGTGNTFLPGIFVQDELKFSDQWTTLAGIRYDQHSVHGAIVTPRLSFKYSPSTTTTLRLTGGSGYRVVNLFTEDHAALTGSREVEILTDLKPEQSWNGNLNVTKNILMQSGFLTLDASAFYTRFSNKIVGDFLTDPNKIRYDNLNGYAVSKGLTVNADASFSSGLKIISGITWMNVYQVLSSTQETKIPQLHAPRFSGTFTISHTLSKHRLTFDLTGRVNGPMHLPVVENDFRAAMSPWFGLLNFQITKQLHSGLEIYGGIKNLLNFIPRDPLLRPFDPFDRNIGVDNPNGYTFDTSYNYAPVQGAKAFLGLRWVIKKDN